MNFTKTNIEGLIILKPKIIKDNRGYFLECYNKNDLKNIVFVQDNESISKRGVLRGLHFQKPPHAQSKLVRCVKGKVLDIAIDLRKNSKSYGEFESTILSDENNYQLFIPKGFAHGFIVLSEYAIFSYKVDNYYNPESESGIIWNDPNLKINWKTKEDKIIVSEKDKNLPNFKDIINPF